MAPRRPRSRAAARDPTAAQLGRVVAGGLDTQHAFALGVRLQSEATEGHLEPGQVVALGLDHGCEGCRLLAVPVRAALRPEEGLYSGNVQAGPGAVHDPVEDLVHDRPIRE